jgi:hypothetical protein
MFCQIPMTIADRKVRTILFCMIVCVLVLTAACCSGTRVCNCPSGAGFLSLPTTLQAPIASVSATQPCAADLDSTRQLVVISFLGSGGGACEVYVRLTDGTAYQTSVRFQNAGACPCLQMVDGSVFEPSDGGTSD